MISQEVAEANLRHLLDKYEETIPTVLEIPGKEEGYDPKKDFIMKNIMIKLGLNSLDELREKGEGDDD